MTSGDPPARADGTPLENTGDTAATPRRESSREVFRGSLIRVEVERWPAGEREIVRHPGACAVVALTERGDVVLVRQFREAIGDWSLEVPAGVLDHPGESPAECVAREVLEETGHVVESVEPLGSIHTSPGFTDERIHLFRARASLEPEHVPEAGIEVVVLPLEAAVAEIRAGTIIDAKSVAALLLAGQTP
jgi:ADP-ribose pyrophosphatase